MGHYSLARLGLHVGVASKVLRKLRRAARAEHLNDLAGRQRALIGRELSWRLRDVNAIQGLAEVEFSVFSQFGDDGIIQWLIQHVAGLNEVFVEFGVEDYQEANTRFLLINNNWRGLVMDASDRNIGNIRRDPISWRHELQSAHAFITAENIDQLLLDQGFAGEIGLLHIDIDGNDYWVWRSLSVARPAIAIIEYNSVFGPEREITVPYDPHFSRTAAHHSNLYFGASLAALCELARSKGYDFVGSNSAGNNAYFIRSELPHGLKPLTAAEGYVVSKFAESRDEHGRLSYLRGAERLTAITGLPVVNTRSGAEEQL